MASKIEVGSKVVENRGTQTMRVLGFGEIDGRQHAWCEWCDEKNVARSQQFPVDALALAVDRGGRWAAGGL
jgi:hypothetical protein